MESGRLLNLNWNNFVENLSSLGKALNALSRDIQILDSDMVGLLGRDSGDSGRAIDLLTTTAKTILGGVNELDGEIGTLSSLTTGNKSTIVASINELDSDLGALTSLSSEVRDSNVAATINALNTKVNNRNRFLTFITILIKLTLIKCFQKKKTIV